MFNEQQHLFHSPTRRWRLFSVEEDQQGGKDRLHDFRGKRLQGNTPNKAKRVQEKFQKILHQQRTKTLASREKNLGGISN